MTSLRDEFDKTYEKGGFTYVSWSQVADRLDEVGEAWDFAIVAIGADWVHGRLTIGTRHFENIGYAENAEADWKKEALKDATSDAFKRCAALAGVARYLYDKDTGGSGRAVTPPPARPSRPTVVPSPVEDPFPASLESVDFSDLGARGDDLCPVHQLVWRLVPAGTSKATGKAYEAFYACPERTCKEKPPRGWVA